jgi:hypothetical protein
MPIRIRHDRIRIHNNVQPALGHQIFVAKTLVYNGKIKDFLTFSPHIVSSCIGVGYTVLGTISIKNFITFCVHYPQAGNPKVHTSAQSLIQSIVTALQVSKLTTRKVRWYCNESLQWMQTLSNVRLMTLKRHAGSWKKVINLRLQGKSYAKHKLPYLNIILAATP